MKKMNARLIALCVAITLMFTALMTFADNPTRKTFTDVKPAQWHYVPVMQAAELGLINGFEDGRFGPDEGITRAQMMQILYAKYGTDLGTASGFSDVPENAWFAKAITWAVSKGLITPVSADKFDPNAPLGREAMVYSLYALAGSPAADRNVLNTFTDKDTVAEYAKDAFAWNVSKNIVSGMSATELGPKGNATRAQVAVIVTRYLQNADGVTLPEIEVPEPGKDERGFTSADSVNAIHNVGKDSWYITKGTADKPNANGYFTEANVDIDGTVLQYDILKLENEYLDTQLSQEGKILPHASWVISDEAEEYTLMRAKEVYEIYYQDGFDQLTYEEQREKIHARPDGNYTIAAENVHVGGTNPNGAINGWINSQGHRNLLINAAGDQICAASYKDVWVFTVWPSVVLEKAIPLAGDNYHYYIG